MSYRILYYYVLSEIRTVLKMIGEEHAAFYILTNTMRECKRMEDNMLKFLEDLPEK
jgi:hypothetical protein